MDSVNLTGWYSEMVVALTAFFAASFILSVIVSKSCSSSDGSFEDLAFSMKVSVFLHYGLFWVYSVALLLRLTILPLAALTKLSTDPVVVCRVAVALQCSALALYQASFSNLILEKLHIAFEGSVWASSAVINHGLRALYLMIWLLVLALILVSDPEMGPMRSPLGAVCCSYPIDLGPAAKKMALVVSSVAMSAQLVLFWTLFSWKLWRMLRRYRRRAADEPILEMMRTQTMAMTVMLGTFVLCASLSVVVVEGRALIEGSNVVTVVAMFFSQSFGRYYYELFRCRRIDQFCCAPFEKIVIRKMGVEQEQLADTIASRWARSIEMSTNRNAGEFRG